jgi:hypothetical protein
LNAYLTAAGQQTIRDESEAHRAYLAQLREERDRRGAPVMLFTDAETTQLLGDVDTKQANRRFTGERVTAFGELA